MAGEGPITLFEVIPSRSNPATFPIDMDLFLSQLALFASQMNMVAIAMNLVSVSATSTTSLTIGLGSQTLTVDAGKSYLPGQSVKIAYTVDPVNWMHGDVITYDVDTGVLVVNISTINGSGTQAAWTITLSAPAAAGFPPGHLSGLGLAIATGDPDHDGIVYAGSARDSSNAVDMTLPSDTTKQIDASWSVGDNAGGLFSGSVAAGTVYNRFLIKRSDTGVVDWGWDTSLVAANRPASYDSYRWIGWDITDASANLVPCDWIGDGKYLDMWFRAKHTVATGLTSQTFTVQSLSACIPSEINCEAMFTMHGNSNPYVYLSNDGTNAKEIFGVPSSGLGVGAYNEIGPKAEFIPVLDNQIYYMMSDPCTATMYLRAVRFWR